MKICKRGVDFIQLINAEGEVRACSWMCKNIIGNLLEEDMETILHGKKAQELRQTLLDGTYLYCQTDNCPYLANGRMEDILVEEQEIPKYPSELHLAYEGVCNYDCTCCTSHENMKKTKENDYSYHYDKIEEKLKELLPHVKKIGANGRGELFASKRILKLLSEWKPLAPANEIEVELETNGSLFDEKHWKQIENLGQYHLEISITVMSFQEEIYQHLSGCKYPITKIEENLRFVKKLREEGVIDYLELATVLQEENFREMPEFARRCIEEFGADCVRIRPIMPGGRYDRNIQWFMDVRNPKHPYYEQYVKVMEHPIFQNPKVLLWSGDLPSTIGLHPGEKAQKIQAMTDKILQDTNRFFTWLDNETKEQSNVTVYGIGTLGKLIVLLNKEKRNINAIYDKNPSVEQFAHIPVQKFDMEMDAIVHYDTVLVTVYGAFEQIKQQLREKGFLGKIINLYDFS